MSSNVIVWDLETVPDLRGYAAMNGMGAATDDEVREAIGDKFPKQIYHSIVCIGALVVHREQGGWVVDALGAPMSAIAPKSSSLRLSSTGSTSFRRSSSPSMATTSTCQSCATGP